MGELKFDSNGRLILPDSKVKENEKRERGLIITKFQKNVKNPAIAQLKIKTGKSIENPQEILKEVETMCESYLNSRNSSANAEVIVHNDLVIIESRGSFTMFSILKEVVENLRFWMMNYNKEHNKEYNITIEGTWGVKGDKFDILGLKSSRF